MPPIFVPAKTPDAWKQFLADPQKQWKVGYSARTMAHCWHDAEGLPSEIDALFATSPVIALQSVEPLLIVPEWTTPIAGHGAAPHNDVFFLGNASDGQLVSVTVEGKVDEPFGAQNQSVVVWKQAGNVANRQTRLDFLLQRLNLSEGDAALVAYQLVQRTASAVVEAERFNAPYAVMMVHSFSPTHANFDAFREFLRAFNQTAEIGQLVEVSSYKGIRIFVGWSQGDARFLTL
jgi:hypothetical protein